MTVRSRFTLDTNLLVYSVDTDAGPRHEAAKEIVGRAALRDCVLTIQVLGEFFHATTRKGLIAPAAASAFVRDWLDVFPVVSTDSESLTQAMDAVHDHTLSFWDAMLWATARRAGCATILSEDLQHGRRLGGVEIVDPFLPEARATLDRLLTRD